jgi:hypothetical protein
MPGHAGMTRQMLRLKIGVDEASDVVITIMSVLHALIAEGYAMAVYELREICRDNRHVVFGTNGQTLIAHKLAVRDERDERWVVHESIRHVVLSACEGEGAALVLGDPLVEEG